MHLLLKLFVVQFLLALIASIAQAQPAIFCKPADIQGRIADSAGVPIAGAKVLVQNSPYSQDVYWHATQPEEDLLLGEATSDEDGRFRIKWRVKQVSAVKNSSARAVILVMKQDYAIAFRETSLWMEQFIPFKLLPDVEHVGKVLDDQGKPLADAEVRVDMIFSDPEWVDRGAVFSSGTEVCSMTNSSLRPRVKTDKDGIYRLRGLASGKIVLLQATHPNFPSIRRMQPVDAKSPKSIKERLSEEDEFGPWYNSYGKPLQMVPGKRGKILAIEDVTGKPIADLEVCRFFSGESVKSDKNGSLDYWLPGDKPRLRGVGSSEYYARRAGDQFWSQAWLTVGDGDAPAQLLVPLRRTITGHVRDQDTGKGIEGVAVYALNYANKALAFTDAGGRYTLPAFSELNTIVLNGPKMSYDLPVDRWSNQKEDSSRDIDNALHRRDARFKRDQVNVEVDFTIPKYPKLQVQVVDDSGKPVKGTEVKLYPRATWLPRPSIAVSNESGIAEFDLDRPITISAAWVSNAKGFGISFIEGMPDKAVKLTVEPTLAIPGLLTAKAADGKLRNATGTPILLKYEDEQSGRKMDLDIAMSDGNGRFTVYLPPSDDQPATLTIYPVNRSSIYQWEVDRNEHARADFVLEDDRLP